MPPQALIDPRGGGATKVMFSAGTSACPSTQIGLAGGLQANYCTLAPHLFLVRRQPPLLFSLPGQPQSRTVAQSSELAASQRAPDSGQTSPLRYSGAEEEAIDLVRYLCSSARSCWVPLPAPGVQATQRRAPHCPPPDRDSREVPAFNWSQAATPLAGRPRQFRAVDLPASIFGPPASNPRHYTGLLSGRGPGLPSV